MTDADRDQILVNAYAYGMTVQRNAAATNWTENAIRQVMNISELVKFDKWDELIRRVKVSGYGVPCIEWAAARNGKKVPAGVYEASKNRTTAKELAPAPEAQTPQPNDDTFFITVIQTLKAIQKGNEAIADAISALAADLKDNHNVNTDLICQRLTAIEQNVEVLKNNTRKKGL
jgi:hypothetical protein